MNKCTIPNCTRKYYAKGFCGVHYQRNRLGYDMYKGFRTTHRPCKIVKDVALIPLGIDAKDGYFVVDKEYAYIDKYKWSLQKRGYPVTYIDGKNTLVHHLILGKPKAGMVTDHIDRDKLNNIKDNLRIVTQKTNVRNAGMLSTNTSGHKGVIFDKRSGKWLAQVSYDGKNHHSRGYSNIEDAIVARKELETKWG